MLTPDDTRLGLDIVADASVAAVAAAVETQWTSLRTVQCRFVAAGRAAAVPVTLSDAPAGVVVERMERWDRTRRVFAALTDSDLATGAVREIFVTVAHSRDRLTLTVMPEKVGASLADVLTVRVVKPSAFEMAIVFPKADTGLPSATAAMDSLGLRKATTAAFWESFVTCHGTSSHAGAQMASVAALESFWHEMPPRGFEFPFYVDVTHELSLADAAVLARQPGLDDDSPGHPRVRRLAALMEHMAGLVPDDLRPLGWFDRDENDSPFVVDSLLVLEDGQRVPLTPRRLAGMEKPTIVHVGIIGRPAGLFSKDAHTPATELGLSMALGDSLSFDAMPNLHLASLCETFVDVLVVPHKDGVRFMHLRLGDLSDADEVLRAIHDQLVVVPGRGPNVPSAIRNAEMEREREQLSAMVRLLQRKRLHRRLVAAGVVVRERVNPRTSEPTFLLTLPMSKFHNVAQRLGMAKVLEPRIDGTFDFGFLPHQFVLRGGPVRPLRAAPVGYFCTPDWSRPECVFTDSERFVLLDVMLRAGVDDGGCNLDVSELKLNGTIRTTFPLYSERMVTRLGTAYTSGTTVQQVLGSSAAFYHAWLRFYSSVLLPIALLGIVAFLLDPFLPGVSSTASELGRYAGYAYAGAMALFSTLLIEFWYREQGRLAYKWAPGSVHSHVASAVRSAFPGQVKRAFGTAASQVRLLRHNLRVSRSQLRPHRDSLTKESAKTFSDAALARELKNRRELFYLPSAHRALRYLLTVPTIVGFSAGLLLLVYFIYVLERVEEENETPEERTRRFLIIAMANGVFIPVMNAFYKRVAIVLTNLECHRTNDDYNTALIVKLFFFQSINSYGSLCFVAFVSRDMVRLGAQLAAILVIGTCVSMIQQVLRPLVAIMGRRRADVVSPAYASTDQALYDFVWAQRGRPRYDDLAQNEDYLAMTIQFGYLTLFAAALPWAPLVAALLNLVERRIDYLKVVHLFRRPVPREASDIGAAWIAIIEALSVLAVVSNAALVAIQEQERGSTTNVWTTIVIAEHVVLLLKLLLRAVISRRQRQVDEDEFRQAYFDLHVERRDAETHHQVGDVEHRDDSASSSGPPAPESPLDALARVRDRARLLQFDGGRPVLPPVSKGSGIASLA